MGIWKELLTDLDKQVYEKAGYGKEMPIGKKPVLLVIDVTYEFVGLSPQPILEAIETFPTACGESGWAAVRYLQPVLESTRSAKIPVIYTVVQRKHSKNIADPWSLKKKVKHLNLTPEITARGKEIVDEIKPRENELILKKHAPSAFFGTALIYYLNRMGVDTLLIAGCTTSGCIRATAVDAFSYGYHVAVIEDCVFDRIESSHKMNLFDMQAKVANVVKSDSVISYLGNLS